MPDAGPSDPSSDPNRADSCAGHDYLLCESFEGTAEGDIPNGWQQLGEEVYVSSEQARAGQRSLKLGAIPVWERRISHDARMLGGTHWGRIYYRVELPVPDAFVHSTLVALTGNAPTRGDSEFRFIDTVKQAVDTRDVGSRHNWLFNVQPYNSGEYGRETNYDWEFDGAWHCVEYFIDAQNQAYRFFFDGNEELSFSDGAGNYDRSDLPDGYDTIKVGWNNYQESPPGFTAYIDDIAFDTERIGCE